MVKLSQIWALLNVVPDGSDKEINNVHAITDTAFGADSIGWCSDKNKDALAGLNGGVVLVSNAVAEELKSKALAIRCVPVENPRNAFMKVLQEFFTAPIVWGEIHPSAVIDPSVQLDKSQVNIGPNVVIEKNAVIGNQVQIGANTVIKSETVIGNACKIGCNNTIGGVGFGYELNEENAYELIPHIGNVVLENFVEIGNNVCIDRAVLGSTYLSEHVKVDNLVHIAHGVKIGKNSLVIANAMVAGSVEIGENVWVSPSASIRQKLTVADNALVGMGSVVVKNVEEQSVVAGNPAKPFERK